MWLKKKVSPSCTIGLQAKYDPILHWQSKHLSYINITLIQISVFYIWLQLLQHTLESQTAPLCTPNVSYFYLFQLTRTWQTNKEETLWWQWSFPVLYCTQFLNVHIQHEPGVSLIANNNVAVLNPCDRTVLSSWFPHHGHSQLDSYNDFNISLAFCWQYRCNVEI